MGSAFQSKLARLRREGAKLAQSSEGEPERAPVAETLPAWVGARLKRRKELSHSLGPRGSATGAQLPMTPELQRVADQWELTAGDPARLQEIVRPEGSFAVREERIPLGERSRHGGWCLSEIDHADPGSIARFARDPALGSMNLRDAVYLDTETSGLSGGAGVYVYMVGLGWFEGDTYVSWQSFLRHPGEERAMLAEVAERIRSGESMVSFFGKSFDRHRLEDKMKIAGVEPPFEGRPHLDLYHPFRRLTHGAFSNGKLQTMERELLGFRREKDLPGSLAPAAWFDYLAGRGHRLEGVFLHNHEDVLSLVVLSAYLGRAMAESRVCGTPLVGPSARRAVALAETALTSEERLHWAQEALEREAIGPDRRRMQLLRADLRRRRCTTSLGGRELAAEVELARSAYRSALEEESEDRIAVDLFAGASMLLEHTVRDVENALRMAQRAHALAKAKGIPKAQLAALAARVTRLESKSAP